MNAQTCEQMLFLCLIRVASSSTLNFRSLASYDLDGQCEQLDINQTYQDMSVLNILISSAFVCSFISSCR